MDIGSKPHLIFPRRINHPGFSHRQFKDQITEKVSKHLESFALKELHQDPTRPFFISIAAVKPPFRLEEDGIYLGEVKVLDRIIPVK